MFRDGRQGPVPGRHLIEHEARASPAGQCLGGRRGPAPCQVPDQTNYSPAQGVPLLW